MNLGVRFHGHICIPNFTKHYTHWKNWCWSWNSNTLATWCEELTHWKRPWCWERLKAGGQGDNRGWDGWMESLTQWTWVWASSGVGDGQGSLACCSPWGRRVRHNWATELNHLKNTTELFLINLCIGPGLKQSWDFPGGPVAKTPCFQCREHEFDPWSGN